MVVDVGGEPPVLAPHGMATLATGRGPRDARLMSDWNAATYGDHIADAYDELYPEDEHSAAAVDTLAALATETGGAVLELAIGTGRLALPLLDRGFVVHGNDASSAMVERLQVKPNGDRIPVAIGDMADGVAPGESYGLVFVAFNTFFALCDEDRQYRCFRSVARLLAPGGLFVIEGFVPDTSRFVDDQALGVRRVEPDAVFLQASRH